MKDLVVDQRALSEQGADVNLQAFPAIHQRICWQYEQRANQYAAGVWLHYSGNKHIFNMLWAFSKN